MQLQDSILTIHAALPPRHVLSATFFLVLEYSSVVVGALGGAMIVRRDTAYRYDFTGILGLGLISGVGGGIARDILIGDGPPLALLHPIYLALALAGGLLALLLGHGFGRRMEMLLLVIDAAGLGLFTIAGVTRAEGYGLHALPALLLGVTTAVGGGSLRDVFSGRAPRIFQEGELYALVAGCSAALFLIERSLGLSISLSAGTSSFFGFALRLGAVRFGWKTQALRSLPSDERK